MISSLNSPGVRVRFSIFRSLHIPARTATTVMSSYYAATNHSYTTHHRSVAGTTISADNECSCYKPYVPKYKSKLGRRDSHIVEIVDKEFGHLGAGFKDLILTMYEYIKMSLEQHQRTNTTGSIKSTGGSSIVKGPLFVGVSAPQGCGKTTVTSALCRLFANTKLVEAKSVKYNNHNNENAVADPQDGAVDDITTMATRDNSEVGHAGVENSECTGSFCYYNCIALSLDDFYHTYDQQQCVALEYSNNPLLQYRGNAGTHDLPLLYETLRDLSMLPNGSEQQQQQQPPVMSRSVPLPRYNKAAHNGRGDRFDAGSGQWDTANAPLDIVLFEGWMLGFDATVNTPTSTISAAAIDGSRCEAAATVAGRGEDSTSNIEQVHQLLKQYTHLHEQMHCWCVLAVDNLSQVYNWRQQAETKLAQEGKGALTEEQVRDFVSRFMPAYKQYCPALYTTGPQRRHLVHKKERNDADFEIVPHVLKIEIDINRTPISYSCIDH